MFGEIDLTSINRLLAKANKLLLPRIEKNHLTFYLVKDLETDLELGTPPQPNPERCQHIALSGKELLLVPGLAFDSEHFRLGYGKGHYDELLTRIPNIDSLGIAFREQLSKELLPKDTWDKPVSDVIYF